MNARKALRAKRGKQAPTPPAPVVEAPPAPESRELEIAPLPPAVDGRDEAREAFIRDAGEDASAPPEPARLDEPSASPGESAPPPKSETPSPAQLAAIGAELLDTALQMLGPLAVGGGRKEIWSLDSNEKALLAKTGEPVIAKHLASSLSIEWLFVISLATVVAPKAALAMAELEVAKRQANAAPKEKEVNAAPAPPLVSVPKKAHGW